MKRRVHDEALITYVYDGGSRVLSQTQANVTNPDNPVIVSSPQVSSFQFQASSTYDPHGDRLFSALDVNQNGVIDFNGRDRVTGYVSTYIVKDGALWQESTQSVYPDFDSDRAVTTTKSRRKLTNLGAFAAVSEAEDIRGNVTTSTQAVDRNTGMAVSTTTVPSSVQPQLQTQQYGQLVESVSTSAVTNRYAYDALNRRVAVMDGRGNTSTTTYNGLGQVAYVEDGATNRTTYVYDQYGRQVEVIDALNQSTFSVYDLRGNVVRQYGATYPVWYEYDVHGRMTAMATTRDTTLDPATVDSLDNPSLDVTRWVYDPATGLLVQKLYDDGKGPSYTYSPDGKLATRTWARGVVTEYGYDALGSLLSVNYSDATPDVAYTYDRLGRQLSAIAVGVSTNLYAYSTNTLELVSEIQNGVVLDRSRDTFGRESGIALESDYDVSYAYDGYGRFASVAHAQSTNTFVYSYVPGSTLVSGMTASSGHAWTRSYDHQRNLITSVTNSFNGNLISAFDYANDALGRRTARLDVLPGEVAITNAFGYNVRSEVTSALMGTNAYGYVFDPIGNRIVATNNAEVTSYAANELNQYTNILCVSATPREPTHDDDGNMTFLPNTSGGEAGGEGWYFQWDGENRLIGVSSNDVLLATHTYDHQSRRVGKFSHEDAKTRSYVYDGWNLIQELTHSQTYTLTNSFVWGLDLSGSLQGAGGVGGLLAVVKDSATYIPAWDVNGNITEYVSTEGTIVAHREYDPLGGTVAITGLMADQFNFGFSTHYRDQEIGLIYCKNRYYDPETERFLSRDPIEEAGGSHVYAYVLNNPINDFDGFGLIVLKSNYDENTSLDDLKELREWLMGLPTGMLGDQAQALVHLQFWFDIDPNRENEYKIDMNWLRKQPAVKEALRNLVSHFTSSEGDPALNGKSGCEWVHSQIGNQSVGSTVQLPQNIQWEAAVKPGSLSALYPAMGGFHFDGVGNFSAKKMPDRDGWAVYEFTGKIDVSFKDPYDWHPGLSILIPLSRVKQLNDPATRMLLGIEGRVPLAIRISDSALKKLMDEGLGKGFDIIGAFEMKGTTTCCVKN